MDLKIIYFTIGIILIVSSIYFIRKNISKKNKKYNENNTIKRTSGTRNLIMVDAGVNKETVLATLRQITDIDYNRAKEIVNSTPSKFMVNTSDNEAILTKQALEFVGAKIEIQ